ncbi:bifunctional enoyl-CoA hydratase/phosphate acetyltransferase [Rhodovulum sulfidophilum]|uniref:bifunctional enoyl-CoA hydratase/phosphate acetyltransferase n=1 Tax=Rhodovulum sulfidophilum TaxID=35806 RepID=UPI001922002E|nr:bifunctional enoyl-CoA hydratase/phosphate acetyltransferase [Rhodovulum sulfidophilum]MBL3572630.1 bifunctional enoyl-CoA hydratase/phosphate acetyltransferase [Rhodovulum sulfidophilum]MCE8432125.1 bifunctional enoyl-CoA hydratase/phosphate acetyltransferase [Rhodovulum sulfidophilum]MCF4117261.1 bifunctional enoyl-CoA hydratase/phosphate acetyltransferase [Rhodovulum sulfidophilum]
MKITENRTFDEISVGDTAQIVRICSEDDFYVFASASGNYNPMHLARLDGDGDGVDEALAPAIWEASLISAVLGNLLPGPGTLYRSQSLVFHERAQAGDELLTRVTVVEKRPPNRIVLETRVERCSDGALVLDGEAEVKAPPKKLVFNDLEIPGLVIERHRHFDELIDRAEPLAPLPTAVVCPEEPRALGGALLGARHTIIAPILVGDPDKIAAAAAEIDASLAGIEIVEAADHVTAAHLAVDLVAGGRAAALMKGHLHTDVLLRAALRKENGLRAGRRFTHVFVMDVPGVPHPLMVTDAAINIAPDLRTKVDIVQNAIDLAISIGIEVPKVGVLSAVETVNPDIPSSLDAALLSKMAERGQIRGGMVDGPLAMDNAVDLAAARTKGITSQVAGRAEVLVVPNLDAGNMLAKQLAYISHAEGAGVVMGAKVPIILNSRSDDDKARLASCAVATLHNARLNGLIPAQRAAE